jgi:hypothetical protein
MIYCVTLPCVRIEGRLGACGAGRVPPRGGCQISPNAANVGAVAFSREGIAGLVRAGERMLCCGAWWISHMCSSDSGVTFAIGPGRISQICRRVVPRRMCRREGDCG